MDETAARDNAANTQPDGPRSRVADLAGFDVRQHLDGDALSAYLDDALAADERTAVAAHLTACGDCRRELAEMRATVALLRGLPQYRPRRSFQLGREHAPRARVGLWERLLPALPALRAATIAVAVLLVVVSAGDIVSGRLSDDDAALNAAPPAAPIRVEQAPVAVTAADDRALQDMDGLPEVPSFADAVTSQPADGFAGAAREAVDEESVGDETTGAVAEPPPADLLPAPVPAAPADAVASGDVASSAESQTTADGRKRPSAWRIAEVALVLVLFWLLVSLVGLQRLRRRT